MLKRTLFASLLLSAFLAGCGGSSDSDDDNRAFVPGTYGVIASEPDAPTQRLYQGNVTVDAGGNLSGLLYGTSQETAAAVSGTIEGDGTLDLSIAFTQPVHIEGRLIETEDEYRGRLDGTVQVGANGLEEFEADVVFGSPLS